MANVYLQLVPQEGIPPTTNFPQLIKIAGTNFPVMGLAFDPTTDETIFFDFIARNYGSGDITTTILWYSDTASSGNVVWECQLAAITPDTDTQDIETKAFATLNYVQDTHLGTTGQRLHSCSVTISNLDSIAAGDYAVLRLARDADSTNATDDMTGDVILKALELSWSDT